LLKLEPTIQDWIEEGKLSAGHGRASVGCSRSAAQNALCAAGCTWRPNRAAD
jgi:hypothetical protein